MKTQKKIYQIPEFINKNILLKEVTEIMNKKSRNVKLIAEIENIL